MDANTRVPVELRLLGTTKDRGAKAKVGLSVRNKTAKRENGMADMNGMVLAVAGFVKWISFVVEVR